MERKNITQIRDLEAAYKSLVLEGVVTVLSDDELLVLEEIICSEEITGIRANILDVIRNEHVKRLTTKFLTFRTKDEHEMIIKNVVKSIGMNDIEFSDNYLRKLGINTEEKFKKCPLLLSIDKLSRLYNFLERNGYSEESTISLLLDDKSLEFTKSVLNNQEFLKNEPTYEKEEFKQFINYLNQSIKGTEKK